MPAPVFSYQLTNDAAVILRLPDNAVIPVDPKNADYKAYLAWAQSNTAAPAAAAPDVDALTALQRLDQALQTALINSWLTTVGADANQKTKVLKKS